MARVRSRSRKRVRKSLKNKCSGMYRKNPRGKTREKIVGKTIEEVKSNTIYNRCIIQDTIEKVQNCKFVNCSFAKSGRMAIIADKCVFENCCISSKIYELTESDIKDNTFKNCNIAIKQFTLWADTVQKISLTKIQNFFKNNTGTIEEYSITVGLKENYSIKEEKKLLKIKIPTKNWYIGKKASNKSIPLKEEKTFYKVHKPELGWISSI